MSGWTTVSPGLTGSPSPAGGPPPTRRGANGAIVAVAVAGAIVLACGSFIAGRLTAPKPPTPTAAGSAAVPVQVSETAAPAVAVTPGFTVPDPDGDAVPHPSEGRVWGPSDITSLSIHADGKDLVLTTVYNPATPMNLLVTETAIRLDADVEPSCKNSVLDSPDWLIDWDPNAGITVFKPGANCGDHAQRTQISGAAEVTGSTLTIKIAQSTLNVRPGQKIVARTSASTRIDDTHTTFIQDWAPDNASGAPGVV